MNSATPTEAQIYTYLVDENGWTEEEVHQLLGYYFRHINEDGTTDLTFDQWTELASNF